MMLTGTVGEDFWDAPGENALAASQNKCKHPEVLNVRFQNQIRTYFNQMHIFPYILETIWLEIENNELDHLGHFIEISSDLGPAQ